MQGAQTMMQSFQGLTGATPAVPNTAIPAPSPSKNLVEKQAGGGNVVNYTPTITIQGPVTQGQESSFRDMLQKHKSEIANMVKKENATNDRKAY